MARRPPRLAAIPHVSAFLKSVAPMKATSPAAVEVASVELEGEATYRG